MNFSEAGSCSSVSPVDVDTAISELSANEVANKQSHYSSTRYGHYQPAFAFLHFAERSVKGFLLSFLKRPTTLQSMMNAKLSKQRF